LPFLAGIDIGHYAVNSDRSKHAYKRVKNYVRVVMPEAKYVEDGKDFDKKIAFKVVPV